MTLLLSCILSLFPPAVSDSIVGTWTHTLVTTDATTQTVETQIVERTFQADGTLHEVVTYLQRVRWIDEEDVVLQFRGEVQGRWFVDERNVVLHYTPRSLRVNYQGVSFPDHDDALQKRFRQAFEAKNSSNIRNYVKTMQHVLKQYFQRNNGTALTNVAFQGSQFTATLGQETVAFQRVEDFAAP